MTKDETTKLISNWMGTTHEMRIVVTAYSEFYVHALNDPDFKRVLANADLVTPDGVSVLAAVKYTENAKGKSLVGRLAEGLHMGGEILLNRVGETVTGVFLFDSLTKLAAENNWKIFLLGGWDNVSGRTTTMLLKRFPNLKVNYDAGEKRVGTDKETDKRVIEKINKFVPDILFVAYNPIKQEKWLAEHRKVLKAKVGIGVGGTFNEYLGEFKKAPTWMEKTGLKWLWRVIQEQKRLGRILRAVIVFPWLVFKDS